MLEALSVSLNKAAVFGFVAYIVGAAVLFALFQFIYTRLTPHKEFELIRSGNVAAAIALGGAVIGFAIPASNVIAYSISILDFVVWAVIAALRGSRGHQRRHVECRLHDPYLELIAHGAPDETKQVRSALAGSIGRHGDIRLRANRKNLRGTEEVQLPVRAAMRR
jgi:hypothetical protein